MGFWLLKESHVVKDSRIGFIWLDGKMRDRCGETRL